jgi:hypothetical protein
MASLMLAELLGSGPDLGQHTARSLLAKPSYW